MKKRLMSILLSAACLFSVVAPAAASASSAPSFSWHSVNVSGTYNPLCNIDSSPDDGYFRVYGDRTRNNYCGASIEAVGRIYTENGNKIKIYAKMYNSTGGGIAEHIYAAIETLDGSYPIDVVQTGPSNWPNSYYEVVLNPHEVDVSSYGDYDPQKGRYIDVRFTIGFDGTASGRSEDVDIEIFKIMIDDVVVFEP